MHDLKSKVYIFVKSHMVFVGVILLISLALFLLWFNNSTSIQAEGVTAATVYFDGEYRVADGEWRPIVVGEHIPTTKGDVTLHINFHLMDPDGNPLDDTERIAPMQ